MREEVYFDGVLDQLYRERDRQRSRGDDSSETDRLIEWYEKRVEERDGSK